MSISEDTIREALKQVVDPELFVNIVDLGLVYNVITHTAAPGVPAAEGAAVAVSEAPPATPSETPAPPPSVATAPAVAPAVPAPAGDAAAAAGGEKTNIKIEMTLTSPACPAGPQIIAQSKTVLGRLEGVGDVEVRLVMTPPWTPARMSEDAKDQLGIFE
jgi:metal-sulfur cluster biosynthetic enzyme